MFDWGNFVASGVTAEKADFARSVAQFVDERVVPVAGGLERRNAYPESLVAAAGELGLMGLTVASEHGGQGAGPVAFGIACEEIARGSATLASAMGSHSTGSWLIDRYGTDRQRERWLPDLVTGRAVSGIALTEPDAGSDLGALSAAVTPVGETYVLTGRKTMITHAIHADPLVVLARLQPSPGGRGAAEERRRLSYVVVLLPKGTSGVHVSRQIGKMGHRGIELCELAFDDVVLMQDNLLGTDLGVDLDQMKSGLVGGRIYIAAASTGIARAAYEDALTYASQRTVRGQTIDKLQAIQLKLADMASQVLSARLLYLHAASLAETTGSAAVEAAIAKIVGSEAVIAVTLEAMRVLGGYGFTEDFAIERYFRDAPIMAIGEGTNEVLRLSVARSLAGGVR